jgi:hypothetical protein
MMFEDLKKGPVVRVKLYADGRVAVLRLQIWKEWDSEHEHVKKECLSNRGEWVELGEGERYSMIEYVLRELGPGEGEGDPAYPDE